ncbi:MAG: ribosomal protein S18-alanine N-acetyltransferase [Pseudomonadota bacterium]
MSPEELAHIHARAFTASRPWSSDEFREVLDAPTSRLLCGPSCFLLGRLVAGEAEVMTLAVDPDFQRRGHGLRLTRQFIDQMRVERADSIFLEVGAHNQAARRLYERCGFSEIARRADYYRAEDGSRETAYILRLEF